MNYCHLLKLSDKTQSRREIYASETQSIFYRHISCKILNGIYFWTAFALNKSFLLKNKLGLLQLLFLAAYALFEDFIILSVINTVVN